MALGGSQELVGAQSFVSPAHCHVLHTMSQLRGKQLLITLFLGAFLVLGDVER